MQSLNVVFLGYERKHIFDEDKTALYLKEMPSRTFAVREEKSMFGFRSSKDRLTLSLRVNAAD